MKKLLSLLFLFLLIAGCGALNQEPKEITEKFFPNPEVEINTPAFAKKKGFTKYAEMMAFLNVRVSENSDVVSLNFIGKSQKGQEIPMLVLNKPNGNNNKLRVWIQGGLHGDEPASTEGVLFLFDQLLNNPEYSYLLDKLEIALVPMANIDGFEKQQRGAANGIDLNRDQTKLMALESVILKKAFSVFNAEVALDFHEYRAYRRDYVKMSSFGVTNPYDVMFLYSGNLNVPKNLREYTNNRFVKNATIVLEENNLTHHDYFSVSEVYGDLLFSQGATNARSSATSYALSNAVATLVEIRGVGIGKTSFTRRVYSTFLVGQSYLKTAYKNVEEVRKTIAQAEKTQAKAVVKSERSISVKPMEMIDIATSEKIELEATVRESWKSTSTLSRPRPTAYILLPNQQVLAEKLETLGMNVQKLASAKNIEVEAFTVTEYFQDAEKYEGVHRQKIKTTIAQVDKDFPEGAYIVYMNQPRANFAVETLEPEAPNGFVSFAVLQTELGAELPIYRYLKKEML